MSQWHAHSRAVVFHTLHRGQRDTWLCPLLVNFATLYFLFCYSSPGVFLSSSCHSSPPSSSDTAIAYSRATARSIPAFSHHRIPTHAPGALSGPSHRSNSDYLAIYCVTVFWIRLMYSSIVKKPAASLATVAEVYLRALTIFLCRSYPVSRISTWVWNPPRAVPIQGGDHPCLRSNENYRLYHGLKKEAGHPRRCSLRDEYPQYPPPHRLFPGQVPRHRQAVVVRHRYHPS